MRRRGWLNSSICILAVSLMLMAAALSHASSKRAAASTAPEPPDWFESRVRPVLANRCGACHSGKTPRGGLDLLSREGMLRGGDHGPALDPARPESSLLVRAIRHDGRAMPPGRTLPPEEIADLIAWVRNGGKWPSASTAESHPQPGRTARAHWAFQPVRRPVIPAVKDQGWVRNPVDAFVLAKLEARGLRPSPQADARTLIRRVYFDLLGLPPAPEEVRAFARECAAERGAQLGAPKAYQRLVDRVLASPRYGERWGRYWLDLARYADSRDYVYFGEARYPFSYTYRDYVIRSLNQDKPYNRFLVEQMAADCLPHAPNDPSLAALGFLTLGRRFVNHQPDIVDDRIDVVFRGTQGLTVTCARCHDHKFDPIPTKDYYSLYGVFAANTEETVPIGPAPPASPAVIAYQAKRERLARNLAEVMQQRRAELSARLRHGVADYLARVPKLSSLPSEETYLVMGPTDVNPLIVRRWRSYIDHANDPLFAAWRSFEALPKAGFAREASAVAARLGNDETSLLFAHDPPTSMSDVATRYGAYFGKAAAQDSVALRRRSPALWHALYSEASPATVPEVSFSQIDALFDEAVRKQLNELQARVDRWDLKSPVAPPQALTLKDLAGQPAPRVFLRGSPAALGPAVPRQMPALLAGAERKPFQQGSGRLELARAIASPSNPLTARVMVNRVWLGHFGRGIVNTPSDFGTRGEAPTHPELLDWLSCYFMGQANPSNSASYTPQRRAWSLKGLHRLILLSAAYQQDSEDRVLERAVDPENRLLWKMSRRRLDFEALHDTLLAAGGRLDLRMGGPAVDLAGSGATRRAVYGLIDRQRPSAFFRTFDFPAPDRSTPQRYATTSPQQALFLMNSAFAETCARALGDRSGGPGTRSAERVRRLYTLLFQRLPTDQELQLGLKFLETTPGKKTAARRYAQALQMTNELVFAD